MEHPTNEARGRAQDGGGEREDPRHPEAAAGSPRFAEHAPSSDVGVGRAPGARGSAPDRGGASWVNWQSVLYVFVLGAVCVPLSSLTGFWWIVPVLGAALPVALAVLDRSRLAPGNPEDGKLKERELLRALAERGDLTPAAAAMLTSLTVDEASEMLEGLVRKGHLIPREEGGVVSYALPERDRRGAPDAALPPPTGPSQARGQSAGAPGRPEDPLSERELEVLRLLASGRTNSEVARDLFVSVGTVKSHTGNIYRKFEVRNRAEAIARARELGLLP